MQKLSKYFHVSPKKSKDLKFNFDSSNIFHEVKNSRGKMLNQRLTDTVLRKVMTLLLEL